tara:strand:+ start:297 stop:620 length:324 start_codon:yes stop_codon:yes gene_type:complete
MPSTPTGDASNINAAQANGDASGGGPGVSQNNVNIPDAEKEMPGGMPQPLKEMSTSDFLSLRETAQSESVMDKLAKIFETILALKLLEDTVENVNKSIEEHILKGEE